MGKTVIKGSGLCMCAGEATASSQNLLKPNKQNQNGFLTSEFYA